jgi:hypothetical protein
MSWLRRERDRAGLVDSLRRNNSANCMATWKHDAAMIHFGGQSLR